VIFRWKPNTFIHENFYCHNFAMFLHAFKRIFTSIVFFFKSKFLRLSFGVINSNNVSSNISLPRLSYYIPKKIILWSILYVDQLYERMLMRLFTGMRKEEENQRGRRKSKYVCLRVGPDIHRDRRVGATEARRTKNRRCRKFFFVSSTISHLVLAYFATCVGQCHCTFLVAPKTSSNILPFLLSHIIATLHCS